MSLSFTVMQTETGSPLLSRRPLTERFLHLLSICLLYKQGGTALLGLTTWVFNSSTFYMVCGPHSLWVLYCMVTVHSAPRKDDLMLMLSFQWERSFRRVFEASWYAQCYAAVHDVALPTVMVNFMCQLDWSWSVQVKHYFWLYRWECFWMRWAFELVT